jgi:hypothetical protein
MAVIIDFNRKISHTWWYISVIPAQEAEAGG